MKSPLFVRRVVGHSMEPTLQGGMIVVATGWRRPKPGDLAIADVDGREVIKRVTKIDSNKVELVSDAKHHGVYAKVKQGQILGKIIGFGRR